MVINGAMEDKEGGDGDVAMKDAEALTTVQESIQEKSTLTLLEQARLASLTTLSSDPSLLPIVPYLIRWISESIETTILVSLGGGAKPTVGGGADLGSTVGIGIGKDVVGRERAMGRMGRMSMGWLVEGMEALTSNDGLFIEPYVSVKLRRGGFSTKANSLGFQKLTDGKPVFTGTSYINFYHHYYQPSYALLSDHPHSQIQNLQHNIIRNLDLDKGKGSQTLHFKQQGRMSEGWLRICWVSLSGLMVGNMRV